MLLVMGPQNDAMDWFLYLRALLNASCFAGRLFRGQRPMTSRSVAGAV